MATAEAEELLEKGVKALVHGHTYLAMSCFEQAMRYGKTPKLCSCLAYCIALNRKQFDEAEAMGREALEAEPSSSLYRLNLGKILLLAGRRAEAINLLREGLAYSRDVDLISQLEELGTRKLPLFKRLPREHFVNKYCGILVSWFGLR